MSQGMNERPTGRARTPVHLWIVGVLALLWNAMGVFDYLATELRVESYLSQFSADQLEYFDSYPTWAVAFWAFGVWGGLVGSIGLLMRRGWAVGAFSLSLLGVVVSDVYNFGVRNGGEIVGTGGTIFTAVICAIAILLLVYARRQKRNGVLRSAGA